MTRQARGVLVGLGLGVVVLQSYVLIIRVEGVGCQGVMWWEKLLLVLARGESPAGIEAADYALVFGVGLFSLGFYSVLFGSANLMTRSLGIIGVTYATLRYRSSGSRYSARSKWSGTIPGCGRGADRGVEPAGAFQIDTIPNQQHPQKQTPFPQFGLAATLNRPDNSHPPHPKLTAQTGQRLRTHCSPRTI